MYPLLRKTLDPPPKTHKNPTRRDTHRHWTVSCWCSPVVNDLGKLTNEEANKWRWLVEDASIQSGNRDLIGCATLPPLMAVSVPAIWNNKRLSIGAQVRTAYNASIQKNRTISLSILDVITTLAVRGISLRGNWNSQQHREDVNFDYFIEW